MHSSRSLRWTGLVALDWLTQAALAIPARAIDCAAASTLAERAICADTKLTNADARMNAAYAQTRGLLEPAKRPGLLAEQRRWLKQRDAACSRGGVGDPALAVCLEAKIGDRTRELERREWLKAGKDGDELRVGSETLTVRTRFDEKGREDGLRLFHAGTPLPIEAWSGYELAARFEGRDGTEAIAVVAEQGGNRGCQTMSVVEAVRGGPAVRVHRVGDPDHDCGEWYTASRTADGLAFRTTAEPWKDGRVLTWRPGEDRVRLDQVVEFMTDPGTTLSDLLANDSASDLTRNEEFRAAMKRLGGPDWRMLARVLGYPEELSSIIDGVNDDYAMFGKCSIGFPDLCPYEAGFAAISRRDRTVYFAILADPNDTRIDLKTYPPKDQWPALLRRALEDWRQSGGG